MFLDIEPESCGHDMDPPRTAAAGAVLNRESILVASSLGQATVEDSLLVREGGCALRSTAARRLW